MTGKREDAQIVVSLVRDRDLAHAIRTLYGIDRARRIQRSLEPQCLSGFRKDENSRILHSDVLIVADAGDFVFYDCIYEELLQSLGPINDDTTVPWTMFNDDVQMGFFDLYDQYLLNILYDRAHPARHDARARSRRCCRRCCRRSAPGSTEQQSRAAVGIFGLMLRSRPSAPRAAAIFRLAARSLELLDQRRRQLHAVGAAVGAALAAILARQPDRIETRQASATSASSLRWRSISAAKTSGAMKRDDVERDHELPGVGRLRCRAPSNRPPRGRTPRR